MALHEVLGDTAARVVDGEHRAAVCLGERDRDRALALDRFDGVRHEIFDDTRERVPVGCDLACWI